MKTPTYRADKRSFPILIGDNLLPPFHPLLPPQLQFISTLHDRMIFLTRTIYPSCLNMVRIYLVRKLNFPLATGNGQFLHFPLLRFAASHWLVKLCLISPRGKYRLTAELYEIVSGNVIVRSNPLRPPFFSRLSKIFTIANLRQPRPTIEPTSNFFVRNSRIPCNRSIKTWIDWKSDSHLEWNDPMERTGGEKGRCW